MVLFAFPAEMRQVMQVSTLPLPVLPGCMCAPVDIRVGVLVAQVARAEFGRLRRCMQRVLFMVSMVTRIMTLTTRVLRFPPPGVLFVGVGGMDVGVVQVGVDVGLMLLNEVMVVVALVL